jgi:hypothetical protein
VKVTGSMKMGKVVNFKSVYFHLSKLNYLSKILSFPRSTNMFTFCRRNTVYLNISGRRVEYAWNWKIWTVAKLGIDCLKTFIAGHRYSEIVEMDTINLNSCIGGHRCYERLYRKVGTSIFKTCTDNTGIL